MPDVSVILAAAGSSTRFNDPNYKKPFALLNRKALWLYSAELFLKRRDVGQVIVVIAESDREDFLSRFGPNLAVLGIEVVIGGAQRADSIENGLKKVNATSELVAVHDAARPCLDADLVERVFNAARQSGAAIPAVPVNSTLKRSTDGKRIESTIDRSDTFMAQTPQVFRKALICELYAGRDDHQPADEAMLAEQAGVEVTLVEGSPFNIKVTKRIDLDFAKACLSAMPKPSLEKQAHPFKDNPLFG